MSEDSSEFNFVQVELPDEYMLVLLMAGLLCVECLVIGMVVPGRARGRVFGDESIKALIESIHLQETG